MMRYSSIIFLFIHVHTLYADFISNINVQNQGFDFIPANPIELFQTYSSVSSAFKCALRCHQDPQCRTYVYDLSICQLYQGSSDTGSIVPSPSTTRIVGAINYKNINVASAYNQSCDHCFPDRYLVCRNNTCQCPTGTFYDNQGHCLNQLYADSTLTCEDDSWCNQALNLSCQCGKCQCPNGYVWRNKTCIPQLMSGISCNTSDDCRKDLHLMCSQNNKICIPQFMSGMSCNTSDQCRNDLNLVCSRKNKTCISMTVVPMPVMTGTLPAKFSYVDMAFNVSGEEWWRAFDNNIYSFWNRMGGMNVLDYIFLTFNDTYLLDSIQLTVTGDITHDPRTLGMYMDENGTCLGESFWFPKSNSSWYTYPKYYFNKSAKALVTNHLLMSIERWSIYQVCLAELTFFGGLY
ncbi:unnamed protein product [Adineta ricciae]|uniref:Apple domain-containing protein n=1 Tax=Adineta ricciae TaxID=249248 RepID=A0A815LJD9_ADIRI|nr:unnamed protein product [Adineta ricciae]CAF1410880.1 unnamed protein product [Adineta ricciae]